jgi:hypothetical protein
MVMVPLATLKNEAYQMNKFIKTGDQKLQYYAQDKDLSSTKLFMDDTYS